MNIEQITTAKTSELVAFYNKNCECFGKRQVKKFADRETAQLRVRQMIEDIEAEAAELKTAEAPSQLAVCLGLVPPSYVTEGMKVNQAVAHAVMEDFEKITEAEHITHREGYALPTITQIAQEAREAMKTSLKLDRTITAYDESMVQIGVWKNAFQMYKEHLDWMTNAQQDRLTAVLYKAAKLGNKERMVINGRTFELVNV